GRGTRHLIGSSDVRFGVPFVEDGDRGYPPVDVVRYLVPGAGAGADLLPGAQVHVADVDVAEGVLAIHEPDDLELLVDLVHHHDVAYGDALVGESAGQQDLTRPRQIASSRRGG